MDFNEIAKKFKESVLRASKKYGVELDVGYLESWHDEQIIIEDATNESIEPQQVYFNTLNRQEG